MAGKKGYKRTISLDFNYDKVKAGVPDINRALRELNAEFNAQAAAAQGTGNKIDALGLKYEKAKKSIELHGDKVKLLKDELLKLEKAEIQNEKAISRKRIELKNAERDLENAKNEAAKFNKELEKQNTILGVSSEKIAAFGDKAMSIGKDLTTRVTLPIVAMGVGAVKLASDMEETIGKIGVVFEQNEQAVVKWAQNSIQQMGLARQTALDMAASFGDLGAGMGLNDSQILEYSTALTKLAADLSSYKNIKVEVAQTALTGIFTGETESLKKLGVVMTQANLQQFAYSQGIQKRISDMTQVEQVQLRYNFVMEATARAHGDFERTGGSAANQARKFKESLKELGTLFGEELLPLATPLIEMLNNIIKGFIDLPAPAKQVILVIGGIAATIGPLIFLIGAIAKTVVNVTEAFGAIPKAISTVSKGVTAFSGLLDNAVFIQFVKWAAIIAGVTLAVWLLVEAINYLIRGTSASAQTLDKISNIQKGMNQSRYRAYAVGTHYAPGGSARLHEYGDEIVDLPRGSRVYTAEQSKRIVENQRKDDSRTADLLQSLIDRVDRLTTKVERLPDRQLALSRE